MTDEQRAQILKIKQEAYEICVEVNYDKYGKLPTKAHATDAGWDLYAAVAYN